MLNTRVTPVMLLKNNSFIKLFQFANPKYIGDPLNSFRILNENEVDEVVILDIFATPEKREPNFELLKDTAAVVFMPLSEGGRIKNRFSLQPQGCFND